jgi:cysteine desulfurase
VSACSSGDKDVSHVLKAIGLSNSVAIGSLRITAGSFTTEVECEAAVKIIGDIIAPAPKLAFPPVYAQVS